MSGDRINGMQNNKHNMDIKKSPKNPSVQNSDTVGAGCIYNEPSVKNTNVQKNEKENSSAKNKELATGKEVIDNIWANGAGKVVSGSFETLDGTLDTAGSLFDKTPNSTNNGLNKTKTGLKISEEEQQNRQNEINHFNDLCKKYYSEKFAKIAKDEASSFGKLFSSLSIEKDNESLIQRKTLAAERGNFLKELKDLQDNISNMSQEEYEERMEVLSSVSIETLRSNRIQNYDTKNFNPENLTIKLQGEKLQTSGNVTATTADAIAKLDNEREETMQQIGDYGIVKKALDATIVEAFGTSTDDIKEQDAQMQKYIEKLLSFKDNPVEFCRQYKKMTGVDFDSTKLQQAADAKELYQQQKVVMGQYNILTNPKIAKVLEEYKQNPEIQLSTFMDTYEYKDKVTPMKDLTVSTYATLNSIDTTEAKKQIEQSFENVYTKLNGEEKSFLQLSPRKQSDYYAKFLENLTSQENIETARKNMILLTQGKSQEQIDYNYSSKLEAAFGKNKLAQMVKDNTEGVELAYGGAKFATITAATLLSGGIAGMVGAGAVATMGMTAAASGAASLTLDTTEAATDSNGLTKDELSANAQGAATTALFTAIGGVGNLTGNIVGSKLSGFGSVSQKLISTAADITTDASLSFAADKALNIDETLGGEVTQSLAGEIGFAIIGGLAGKIAKSVKNAKAVTTVQASSTPKINVSADTSSAKSAASITSTQKSDIINSVEQTTKNTKQNKSEVKTKAKNTPEAQAKVKAEEAKVKAETPASIMLVAEKTTSEQAQGNATQPLSEKQNTSETASHRTETSSNQEVKVTDTKTGSTSKSETDVSDTSAKNTNVEPNPDKVNNKTDSIDTNSQIKTIDFSDYNSIAVALEPVNPIYTFSIWKYLETLNSPEEKQKMFELFSDKNLQKMLYEDENLVLKVNFCKHLQNDNPQSIPEKVALMRTVAKNINHPYYRRMINICTVIMANPTLSSPEQIKIANRIFSDPNLSHNKDVMEQLIKILVSTDSKAAYDFKMENLENNLSEKGIISCLTAVVAKSENATTVIFDINENYSFEKTTNSIGTVKEEIKFKDDSSCVSVIITSDTGDCYTEGILDDQINYGTLMSRDGTTIFKIDYDNQDNNVLTRSFYVETKGGGILQHDGGIAQKKPSGELLAYLEDGKFEINEFDTNDHQTLQQTSFITTDGKPIDLTLTSFTAKQVIKTSDNQHEIHFGIKDREQHTIFNLQTEKTIGPTTTITEKMINGETIKYETKIEGDELKIRKTDSNGTKSTLTKKISDVIICETDDARQKISTLFLQTDGEQLYQLLSHNVTFGSSNRGYFHSPSDNRINIVLDNPNDFSFSHEAGHVIDDIRGISSDTDIIATYKKEMSYIDPNDEYFILYFSDVSSSQNGLSELVAETNAIKNSHDLTNPKFGIRTAMLQKYFPETLAKVADKLSDTVSSKTIPEF